MAAFWRAVLVVSLGLAGCSAPVRDEVAEATPQRGAAPASTGSAVHQDGGGHSWPAPYARPAPFQPSQVYEGEGPPFARLVLRPEGPLWRVSLYGGDDPRLGGSSAAPCHIEAEGPRRGDAIRAPYIPDGEPGEEHPRTGGRWVDVELGDGFARVSTDVFAFCGLGADFDGRYRKLPAVSRRAGEKRVQGLAGAWRVTEFLPVHNPFSQFSLSQMGAVLEITPEQMAWVRASKDGDIDWEYYCATPQFKVAGERTRSLARTSLALVRSATAAVPIDQIWEVRCFNRTGYLGGEVLAVLADGRLALMRDPEEREVYILRPDQGVASTAGSNGNPENPIQGPAQGRGQDEGR